MPQKERRKGNAFSRTDKQSLENNSSKTQHQAQRKKSAGDLFFEDND